MHPTIRQQAHKMQRMAIVLQTTHQVYNGFILFKAAISNVSADAQKILIHHTASAKIEVPHFRITLLPIWQPNSFSAAQKLCMRTR